MRWYLLGLSLLAIAAAVAAWLEWPEIGEQVTATRVEPSPAMIERGRYLARAGNCIGCHTAPGEPSLAGGRRMTTPYGDVFTTNLTPDEATGIGAWSAADFWRALHYGKGRDGRRLYPAFPYDSFTRVTRMDSDAIFAYLKSLPPASSEPPPSTVRFPYNTELAMRVWRALYFRPGEVAPDAARSAQWNRGAYLVEGLGHCNACHGPSSWRGAGAAPWYADRGVLPLEWDAAPLGANAGSTEMDARDLAALLKTGTSRNSAATGPMAEIVFHSLQYLRDADIAAIVEYVRSLPRSNAERPRFKPIARAERRDALWDVGARTYDEYCSDCHGTDGRGKPYVYPALAGSRIVTAVSANNALQAVLYGGFAPSTAANPRPYGMPPYADRLSPTEVAGVLTYVRSSWGNDAPSVSPAFVGGR